MSEDRVRKLTANKRYLFFANLFTKLKFLNAIVQLFYISRGLSLGQVVYLSVIWSVVALLAEFPSSVLADSIGRKKTLIIGILLMAIGNLITLYSYGFLGVTVGLIFQALGFAFNTGTGEALLYDTMKELRQENFSTKISGKYFSSDYLAKIVTPFIGSLIAADLTSSQFNILIGFDLAGTFIALFFALLLIEPERHFGQIKSNIAMLKDTWKLLSKNTVILKYALNKIGIFIATYSYWRVYQVYLIDRGVEVFYLGLIYVFFQSVLFLILWNSEKIKQKVGLFAMFIVPPVIGAGALILIILFPVKYVLIIATIVLFSVGTVRDPIFLTQIQLRLQSFNRATTTSALNIMKSSLEIPILFLVGYLANINIAYSFYVPLFLFIAVFLFANIKKEDILETR